MHNLYTGNIVEGQASSRFYIIEEAEACKHEAQILLGHNIWQVIFLSTSVRN